MDFNVNINGIDVNAKYSEESIRDIFVPLLKKLEKMQKEKGARLIVMLAAPPGAGKSTLVNFLEVISKDHLPDSSLQAIGMDGFHRRQEYLQSHTTIVDGKEIDMVKIKGAPITFDLDLLKEYIGKLSTEKVLGWPSYDRHLHNPVDNAIKVNADIVILEGNYLLLDEEGWKDLSAYADYTISLKADEELLRKRLVDRKEASGNSREDAEAFVEFSDMRNVKLCLEHTKEAELELCVTDKNEYKIFRNESMSFN